MMQATKRYGTIPAPNIVSGDAMPDVPEETPIIISIKYKPYYNSRDLVAMFPKMNRTSAVRMAKLHGRITPADLGTHELLFEPEEVRRFALEQYNIELQFEH